MRGDVDRKMQAMTTIIGSIASEQFGEKLKEGGSKGSHSKNQREERIHNIRQDMKTLKRLYKQAGEEEHTGLAQDVHPMKEDQDPPPGRMAPEALPQKSPEASCLHCQPL